MKTFALSPTAHAAAAGLRGTGFYVRSRTHEAARIAIGCNRKGSSIFHCPRRAPSTKTQTKNAALAHGFLHNSMVLISWFSVRKASKCRGRFPRFFLIWGNNAGTQNGKDLYSGLDLKTRKMLLGSFREQIETFGFAGRDRESGSALFFLFAPFPLYSSPLSLRMAT